jgi:hypothetical protein
MASATLGIDLSAQPRETACCALEWADAEARVLHMGAHHDNRALVELAAAYQPSKIAIDSPFGWPREFTMTILEFTESGRWAASDDRRAGRR